MDTEKQGNGAATSLAAAIMMVMPLTIGYYLVRFDFGQLDFPPIFVFLGGCIIAMGGSGLLAWGVYKLVGAIGHCTKRGAASLSRCT